jgi:hypothetical protein
MQATAPDLIRAVIGFRQWRLRRRRALVAARRRALGRGLQTARCPGEDAHDGRRRRTAARAGSTRGTRRPAHGSRGTSELVGGAVALWGQVELHAHGVRAQHAMIVALALPLLVGRQAPAAVARGQRARGPAVPARKLKAAALEHGDVIPRRMRPPDTTPNKRAAPGPDPAALYAVADGLRRR